MEKIRGKYWVPNIEKKFKPWKGHKIIKRKYWVTNILAKRRSGKSVLIANLVKQFVNPKTIVLFFSGTYFNDDTYDAIREYLDKRGIIYEGEMSMIDDNGDNLIRKFINHAKAEAKRIKNGEDNGDDSDEEGAENGEAAPVAVSGGGWMDNLDFEPGSSVSTGRGAAAIQEVEKPKKQKKKSKKQAFDDLPEYLIILDDISDELKNRALKLLVKNSKHYKIKLIISSQDFTDVLPSIHAQGDICCIFKETTDKRLEYLFEKLSLWGNLAEFKKVYKHITSEPYEFLLIDRQRQHYRKGLFLQLTQEYIDAIPNLE